MKKIKKNKFLIQLIIGILYAIPLYSQISGTITNCATPTANNGTISLTIKGGEPPYTFIYCKNGATAMFKGFKPLEHSEGTNAQIIYSRSFFINTPCEDTKHTYFHQYFWA